MARITKNEQIVLFSLCFFTVIHFTQSQRVKQKRTVGIRNQKQKQK